MKRSKFSLSHYNLLSCNMGSLVPIGLTEVLPGDTLQHNTNALIRCSPLIAPPMHPVDARIHHWFIPTRLIWEDFEDFITGGPDGMDASDYPTITLPASTGAAIGSLADYLGATPEVADLEVSALPFRAYALLWNEWYRDQDLQTEVTVDVTSGADTTTNTDLLNAAWEKDYFTSSRPWEQKGPAITVPIGDNAPVTGIGIISQPTPGTQASPIYETDASGSRAITGYAIEGIDGTFSADETALGIEMDPNNSGFPNIRADLTNASAVTVNVLREAMALQRYEEARARYGSRYTEYLRYLNVRSSDARLQRPEYLGGGRSTIQFSEVLQTSKTDGTDPLGTLGGHGLGYSRSNRYRRFFEEHGYVISTLSVRPKTIYAQGLNRSWNRRLKEDYWQQELQHIGQQEVLNKEVYAPHSTPEGVFGYQDRYDEYRRQESRVSGEFRTSTLDFWHFARIFGSDPALNADFVECVPTERTFAVPDDDVLHVMAKHSIQARRLVAKTGHSFIY